ncbi:MAG: Nodulation protein H [Salinibacter sp.]|uniref:Nodulation protein H n=1 Tax=Salinibacter sp. TaxID=2065818 RepID=UPI002FC34C02
MPDALHGFAKTVNVFYAGYAYEAAQHLRPTVRSTPPETRFVLFARGRSGTTLLLSMLNAHPAVEADGEILRRRALRPLRLVKQCKAQTQAPVYGFKLLSYQLRSLQTHLSDRRAFLEALVEQGYRVLYLRRRNLLRHALSGLYAEHRRRWHQTDTDATDRPAIRVRRDDLFRWLDGSAQLRRFEQEVLDGLPHLSLTYEEHLEDPARHADTLHRTTDRLDLDPIAPDTSLRKTTPRRLSDLATNPDDVRRWVAASPYARFLSAVSA